MIRYVFYSIGCGKKNITALSNLRKRKYGQTIRVPMCHYWVEGDNLKQSQDSNSFGPVGAKFTNFLVAIYLLFFLQVSEGLIIGLITYILWPPDRGQKVKYTLTPEQSARILR